MKVGALAGLEPHVEPASDVIAWPKEQWSEKYQRRRGFAELHLFGDGVEIGAKQAATLLPDRVRHQKVRGRLVDELNTESLLRKYSVQCRTIKSCSSRVAQGYPATSCRHCRRRFHPRHVHERVARLRHRMPCAGTRAFLLGHAADVCPSAPPGWRCSHRPAHGPA